MDTNTIRRSFLDVLQDALAANKSLQLLCLRHPDIATSCSGAEIKAKMDARYLESNQALDRDRISLLEERESSLSKRQKAVKKYHQSKLELTEYETKFTNNPSKLNKQEALRLQKVYHDSYYSLCQARKDNMAKSASFDQHLLAIDEIIHTQTITVANELGYGVGSARQECSRTQEVFFSKLVELIKTHTQKDISNALIAEYKEVKQQELAQELVIEQAISELPVNTDSVCLRDLITDCADRDLDPTVQKRIQTEITKIDQGHHKILRKQPASSLATITDAATPGAACTEIKKTNQGHHKIPRKQQPASNLAMDTDTTPLWDSGIELRSMHEGHYTNNTV